MGECYFATSPDSEYHPGAYIQMAASPDLLHWKPEDRVFMRARRSSLSNVKIGGGTPPVLTPDGWLMLFHGVENSTEVGIYRTFWAILDATEPRKILYLQDNLPLLESNPSITLSIRDKIYLQNVVFTTGIVSDREYYIIASGELDLACRITRISKRYFSETFKTSYYG
jgi:predicted GH43/DUF377 family glycosyl hydrolase